MAVRGMLRFISPRVTVSVVLAVCFIATTDTTTPTNAGTYDLYRWASIYDGLGGNDVPQDVAVDSSGVYVTGTSVGSGTGFTGFATVKYGISGTEEWAVRYDGPTSGIDSPVAIAVDAAGNAYVTGGSAGSGTGVDYATVKYDSSGSQVWAARYNGAANGDDSPMALAVDTGGNVYVTGTSWGGISSRRDWATVKYDGAGNEQWANRFDGPAGVEDAAYDVAADAFGGVYVTGLTSTSPQQLRTVKYASNGSQLWAAEELIGTYRAKVAVDPSGFVVVAGSGYDYIVYKYGAASGNQVWSSSYDGPSHGGELFGDVALNDAGDVYVTGYSQFDSGYWDYELATVKFSASGAQQWVSRADAMYATGAPGLLPARLAVDSMGNAYVLGTANGVPNGDWGGDFATIKYGPTGNKLWSQYYNTWNGGYPGTERGRGLGLDDSGNLYVTGDRLEALTLDYDYVTLKYSALDVDQDTLGDATDNCVVDYNPSQSDNDGDSLGDACDPDDDNDGVLDTQESGCGTDPLSASSITPERIDGAFATVDDDGDTLVDEGLPGGSEAYDCDGDGYAGTAEAHVFSASGGQDQDPCGADAWPADLTAAGAFSLNKVNISDLASYVGAPRYFNTNVGTNPGDVRWDVVPGSTFGNDINIVDLQSISSGTAPMLGGVRMFNGPSCPWPP